ncbi:DnaJsubfamily B member 5 [Sesamum angolense]|uniref:DnaJsubfamily B member 5 n=1 Tax=Sesamum angolense TaxID=2727404 RepID=A0AAE1X4E5_9LAMI|nr:DnaJsubfamily B member 5 [Sesamum angolense]
MEHPFFPTTTTRAEALRWLTIAEKLLSARDLMGSKSFASRARDSDPTLSPADQILAVADTLLAGDRRIGNNQQDWYAILRLTPQQGRDAELIATQYRNLALLLNPQKNKFPFAEQAFRLVVDAWSVLSNPSRKSLYDKELAFYLQPQQQPDPFSSPIPGMHQNFIFFGGSSSSGVTHPLQPQGAVHFSQVQQAEESYSTFAGNVSAAPGATQEQVNNKNEQPQQNYSNVGDKTSYNVNVSENVEERIEERNADKIDGQEERVDEPANDDGSTFWTACPYCYHMYEYPGLYADCTLRCQNCKRAFQAVVIPSPPPIVDGQEGYFCCWGFLPLGFSMENWEKNRGAASSWTPFSPMYTCPQAWNGNNANKKGARKSSAPRVYVDDDEVFVEISESSESDDDDWRNDTKKTAGESSKKGSAVNARKQPGRVAKNKLDLNVEFSNEAEEPAPRANQGNGPSRGEDDNIEGIGFFEGLDEFLSSLPILNVVGDDKVVKAA